ncbi:MAG: F0F1 ATP synthase subunit delta [Acutalibacteraceae bacterium]
MKKAKIICAPSVSDEAYRYLCDKLTAQYGEIEAQRETDASLLGGFVVLFDGKVYDMSLRAQLDALRASCEQ